MFYAACCQECRWYSPPRHALKITVAGPLGAGQRKAEGVRTFTGERL